MPEHRQPYREFVTPEDFPVRSPSPPIEHNLDTAHKIGGLMEAVAHLKGEAKDLRDKVTKLSEEVHGYKVAFRWVIGVCITAGTIIGWAVNTYVLAKKP
jgi:hypothetical protein